ncbi:MAG: hypothetical protein ISP82_00795 [Candidatus Poseidoniaceae archaeon]|nr:hypothetical protein [Candidatus Poseidoniaceae archaeon]MBL6895811.1 hypothetical protein [Candidatus Poseidoniaceae archaeon]MDA8545335.1 hypothetical protein [Candidatus Poseidoniales archaeon]MDC3245363.1 hypothetical protein [bacterium]
MAIHGVDKHEYSGLYPCRLPVWWGFYGKVGLRPRLDGISGKAVVLRIEKRFNRIEKVMAKLFRAPKEVRRPLDVKNSMLWQLCDGSRSFEDICTILDSLYHEDISPVIDRTAAGINLLKSKNLMTLLSESFNGKWAIEPGITPDNQTLKPLDNDLGITTGEE